MSNDRRRRSLSPRQRERRDERFRQDIERIRAQKGLPPLEPAGSELSEPTTVVVDSDIPTAHPARPTPRREPPRPPATRICIACRRERTVFGPPESSLICASCTRGGIDTNDVLNGRTLPPTRVALPGMPD
jgi:hypothetical protein